MNYLDIIILIPIIVMFVSGFRNGAIVEVATLAGLVLGVWVAINFTNTIIDYLNLKGEYSHLIGYLIAFLGVMFLVTLLSRLLTKLLDLACLGGVNRIVGGLFGAAKALIIVMVVVMLFDGFNKGIDIVDKSTISSSLLYNKVVDLAQWAMPRAQPVIDISKDLINQIIE